MCLGLHIWSCLKSVWAAMTKPLTRGSGGLINNTDLFLTVVEAGSPRSRCQHGHLLVGPST